jgi:hypothetical protein
VGIVFVRSLQLQEYECLKTEEWFLLALQGLLQPTFLATSV